MSVNDNQVKAGIELFDQLTEEVWFGLNLRLIFAEATVEERDAVRVLLDRAKAARQSAKARINGASAPIKQVKP